MEVTLLRQPSIQSVDRAGNFDPEASALTATEAYLPTESVRSFCRLTTKGRASERASKRAKERREKDTRAVTVSQPDSFLICPETRSKSSMVRLS